MNQISELKLLENDLLWEVEINASNAALINKLIMPNNIDAISTSIVEQLRNVTKSKYCYAGCLDSESAIINYTITAVVDNKQGSIYNQKIALDAHSGSMGKILEKQKTLLTNTAKDTNGSLTSILGKDIVERYILAPVIIGKDLVGQIGIVNSPHNYAERELMFVKRMASIFALAIQRYRMDQILQQANQNLEDKVEKRTQQLLESNKLLRNEIDVKKAFEKELKKLMDKCRQMSGKTAA